MQREINKTSVGTIQVFELTMDNPENQDELNRKLRKPGESAHCDEPQCHEPLRPADAPSKDVR